MLLYPLWSPAINFNVINQVNAVCHPPLRKLRTTPCVRHQMVVVTKALVDLPANVCEGTDQMVQSLRVSVNEQLVAVLIRRETQNIIRLWHKRAMGSTSKAQPPVPTAQAGNANRTIKL